MNLVDFEVHEIKKICENVVPNAKIISCTTLPSALVRIDISSQVQKHCQVTVLLRFPIGYPQQVILIELKSRNLSDKFLSGLVTLCESQARQHVGKPQGLNVLRFVQQYLHENPLCVCFDEIQQLRNEIGQPPAVDQLKLKQRKASVLCKLKCNAYYYRVYAFVPGDYPVNCVQLQDPESNLPAVLVRFLNGQSHEIARQCVEPPLALSKDKCALFQPTPSLYKALKFCIDAIRTFPTTICPICKCIALPEDPEQLELHDKSDAYIERVYCGHLYHQGCLKHYLEEPPFPKNGKVCQAQENKEGEPNSNKICGIVLAHDRWTVNMKVAETRWAQKAARQRELEEVVDFLN